MNIGTAHSATATGTDPATTLAAHLAAHLGADSAWAPALRSLAGGLTSLHLALLTEPFLSLLMNGTKTIESRFSRVRCAPYGCLARGDVIAVKKTGGPVLGAFIAGPVTSHQLTRARVTELRERFAAQLCASDDGFWEQRSGCAYATLVAVEHVRHLPGITFPKKDRRGRVQLTQALTQDTLLCQEPSMRSRRLPWRSPGRSARARPPSQPSSPPGSDGHAPPTVT